MKRKSIQRRLEQQAYSSNTASSTKTKKVKEQTDPNSGTHNTKGLDHAGSPSSEISEDAAPVGHAPVDNDQRVRERSKYEAAEPYRSKKGDRFS
ncbi:hypothetical protein HRR80_007922 [Exophiala dermatitidis]|nr:hypothetical protein HRR77_009045 [Exophiala dermatitidis]KAJ4540074.1 hypothetical protein HRR76_003492 [Exophiala dermatitidis]KAJ4557135.1 hypothetical protein HRR79_008599 [Exophiala dermatitidis]KAJ4579505.1 hypothetical protein HRR82_004648 [Exophiala dermatitidis]KAJ4608819.1 hypothetical protein HRR85_007157 [Exophiala dermatitidis]